MRVRRPVDRSGTDQVRFFRGNLPRYILRAQ